MRIFNPQDQLGKDLARKEQLLDVYDGNDSSEVAFKENAEKISFKGDFVSVQKDENGDVVIFIRQNNDWKTISTLKSLPNHETRYIYTPAASEYTIPENTGAGE